MARGGILACGAASWLAVTLMQRVLIQKGDPFRSWRILVLLLWFAKKGQTIQYSRTEFRKKKRELNVPLVGYPAPSFSRIVGPRRMIQTNKFCFPEKELPGERQSISQAPFVLPFRSSFLANSFHCGFWRSAMRRSFSCRGKRDVSEEKNPRGRDKPLEGPSIADQPETHPSWDTSMSGKEMNKRR